MAEINQIVKTFTRFIAANLITLIDALIIATEKRRFRACHDVDSKQPVATCAAGRRYCSVNRGLTRAVFATTTLAAFGAAVMLCAVVAKIWLPDQSAALQMEALSAGAALAILWMTQWLIRQRFAAQSSGSATAAAPEKHSLTPPNLTPPELQTFAALPIAPNNNAIAVVNRGRCRTAHPAATTAISAKTLSAGQFTPDRCSTAAAGAGIPREPANTQSVSRQ